MVRVGERERLRRVLAANRPGSRERHVLVNVPSYSVPGSLLAHYADRIQGLEHRYLLAVPMLARIPGCEMVFLCSTTPAPEVVEDYLCLVPAPLRQDCRRRLHVVTLDDDSLRPLTAKALRRPEVLDRVRRVVGDLPAFLEPWNVTEDEMRLAAELGIPVNGTPPELRHLGFKSEGRRVFRAAGVPVADGVEDVASIEGVLAALARLRRRHPAGAAAVVKTDDSGAGDGNRVVHLGPGADPERAVHGLPSWYVADLLRGAVVEELVLGERFSSPSAQVDIGPDGAVEVIATHEQVLGGPDGQVYLGCRFPAEAQDATLVGRYARATAQELARRGALGRVGVDFVAVDAPDGGRRVVALEINLRKGGTTHPYTALRHLVPGTYDVASARWVSADGTHRFYEATDNLVDPRWRGRPPGEVIEAVRAAGLRFDPRRGTGVVLHMLSCLAVDGRLGVVAIGRTRAEAGALMAGVPAALDR